MVESSVLLGLVVLLAVALGPAHRHAALPFRPGEDTSVDRDRARVVADLRAAHPATTDATEHGEPAAASSVRRAGGPHIAYHRLPGSDATCCQPITQGDSRYEHHADLD